MRETDSGRRTLEASVTSRGWSVLAVGTLILIATAAAIFELEAYGRQIAIVATALLGLIFCGLIFAYRRATIRLERYRMAECDVANALNATDSGKIRDLQVQLSQAADHEVAIRDLYNAWSSSISRHLEEVFEAEALANRRMRVAKRCASAKQALSQQIEERRLASPAIRAEATITGAIDKLKHLKAEAVKKLDEQRKRKKLTWWFDLTRPDFEEVDARIEELEAARQRLIASGDVDKTNDYYRGLASLVERRTAQIERCAISAIPAHRHETFDDRRIVQNVLLLSSLSVPVSAWRDISQAGVVYDTLREVNGNYAGMSDVEIWLDTLTMPAPELAGLASLTKGALFEKYVETDFGGERFEHFNHPDTDIVIDGIAYQIKATDSASYINSVPDDIPVISTSEIAGITDSIDGGYTNDELIDTIDLALGGTVIDIGDAALDALLTGVGGVSIFAILRGVQGASAKYAESGNATEALIEGISVTATSTARSAVNMAEIATKGVVAIGKSKPARFTGSLFVSAAKKFDQWLEQPDEQSPAASKNPSRLGNIGHDRR